VGLIGLEAGIAGKADPASSTSFTTKRAAELTLGALRGVFLLQRKPAKPANGIITG
jgi:hypothetical protein